MDLEDDLKALAPRGKATIIDRLGKEACTLDTYGIDTPQRLAHFWAQAYHETAGFKTLVEYWGPTPAQKRYEGRTDLGNNHSGDGHRFRGRGIFQLTGRANYSVMSARLGKDLVAKPDLASDPQTSLEIACLYWETHGCNALADKNDIIGITKRINGGTNGLPQRRAAFVNAWAIFGTGDLPAPSKTMVTSKEGNAAAAAVATSSVAVASEVIDRAQSGVGVISSLSEALGRPAIIALIFVALACGAIWYWRSKKLQREGV